ncbi:MAG: uracil-DNA glycosylase [Rhodospirillaceae bacterium]|nr:uracil-DNA glycosylase [Rhodospirillaceae bacterium]
MRAPDRDCPYCPRLVEFRAANRARSPNWHNGPVQSFGGLDGQLLVVGLAPGLKGANRTGRPFTGDEAGNLLYPTLLRHGFAQGTFKARADDGFTLRDCRVTNAVRCVPPANRPQPAEVAACRGFLSDEIAALPNLRAILALGAIAHAAALAALSLRLRGFAFSHGARHLLPSGLALVDSYHCSRLNTNTGRLTPAMFDAVVAGLRQSIGD